MLKTNNERLYKALSILFARGAWCMYEWYAYDWRKYHTHYSKLVYC